MIRKIPLLLLTVMAALMVIAAGCAKSNATTSQPPSMPALNGRSLAGTSWVLASYGDPSALKTVIPGTKPTLIFNSDTTQVSGTGGVNGFGGDCARIDNQITFTQLIHTLIASLDPAVNLQENAYFNLLQAARSVTIGDGTLTINCDGGQVLNFKAAASPSPIVPPITTPAASQSSTSTGSAPSSTGYTIPTPPSPVTTGGTQTTGSPTTVTLTATASPPAAK